jgi:hypothetical protein
MKEEGSISFDKQIYYRLIALWVLCESVMGGIIHGFKLPFSGLIIGSSAVICICLIAYYVPVKGAILKATVIVAIFKMMLSPQTPPTAYIAVFFQGAIGQLLFYNLKNYKLSCMFLGVLALVESALQRIIVLTLIYGATFWKAINEFINKLTHQKVITNYSLLIAGGYILFHILFGLMIGAFAAKIVKRSEKWKLLNHSFVIDLANKNEEVFLPHKSSAKKAKPIFIIIWLAFILLFFQSYFKIGAPLLPSKMPLQIIVRSVIIVLTWYLFISPLLIKAMRRWLLNQKQKAAADIQQVVLLLPSTKYILTKSWELSATKKGLKRLKEYCKIVLINTLR